MLRNEQVGSVESREGSIAKLRECLEAELAAAETYEVVLRYTRDVEIVSLLRMVHDSHERRAIMVWSELVARGGDPPRSAKAWSGVEQPGSRDTLAALVDGEDRSTRLYSAALESCEPRVRDFIRQELLPEQFDTLHACASLLRLVGPLDA